jgi:hypothetical protein
MLGARKTLVLLVPLAAAFAVAYRLGAEWNARLEMHPVDGDLIAAQASMDFGSDGGPQTYQHVTNLGSLRVADYGFQNFNQDRLHFTYKIPDDQFKKYNNDYGYLPEDLAELRAWHKTARNGALQYAIKNGKSQAQLDAALAVIDKQYTEKLHSYLSSRGFVLEGDLTRIDMPSVVKRNGPYLKPIALVLDKVATEHNYQSMDIIGAGLSFVQTALKYQQPDDVYKGKHTGAFIAPLTSVVLGWGNCDSKSALLGSILANWAQMRMIGIFIPGNPTGHYLMGVLQIPDQGDVFVEYQGLKYVLLEPAGPAWLPPGHVGEESMAKLNVPEGYKIDPFF